MNKNAFIRLYLWLSIVFVLALMFLQNQFSKSFVYLEASNYGSITSSIFKYRFENLDITLDAFNVPLIMFIAFALLSSFVAYLAIKEEPIKTKILKEVVIYNVILSVLLIVSSIVFMLLIPDGVNGAIENGFFMTKFEVQRGDYQNAFNFTKLFMTVYIVLNIVALYLTKEKNFKVRKENIESGSEFLL